MQIIRENNKLTFIKLFLYKQKKNKENISKINKAQFDGKGNKQNGL